MDHLNPCPLLALRIVMLFNDRRALGLHLSYSQPRTAADSVVHRGNYVVGDGVASWSSGTSGKKYAGPANLLTDALAAGSPLLPRAAPHDGTTMLYFCVELEVNLVNAI